MVSINASGTDFKSLKAFKLPTHSIETYAYQKLAFASYQNARTPTILLRKNVLDEATHDYQNTAFVAGWIITGSGLAVLFGQVLFDGLFGGFGAEKQLNATPFVIIGVGSILLLTTIPKRKKYKSDASN